jgi:MoxR-like ATPase
VLVGEPGLAKSQLIKETTKLVPNSRYESGQNSSGKSLTAIVTKEDENYVLRLGPVPLAKEAICAINELGRMSFEDQAYLLDTMEEGEFTINKYGINARIRAPTAIIASANPLNNSSWIHDDKIDLDEIPAIKPLIDRFDLMFVFRTLRDATTIREYAERKSDLEDRLIPDYYTYLKKHIIYAKQLIPNPKLSDEAKSMLNDYWINLAENFGSPRILETLFRLAKSRARLKLKQVVDAEDARETMQFYNIILQQHQQVVSIPDSPRDVTYNECVSILKESKLAITLDELVKSACQRNEQVKRYLGDNKRPLRLQDNWKLRSVYEMLLNHEYIKRVNEKPIVFQWLDNNSSSDGGSNGDHGSGTMAASYASYTSYDVYDAYEVEGQPTKIKNPQGRIENNTIASTKNVTNLQDKTSDTSDTSDSRYNSTDDYTNSSDNNKWSYQQMSSSPSSNDNNIEGIFWERFEELASQNNDVGIVDHTKLQASLVSSDRFHVGDARLIIEEMVKAGKIIEVDFHKYKKKIFSSTA